MAHLTGANIAPEGGVWGLDSGGGLGGVVHDNLTWRQYCAGGRCMGAGFGWWIGGCGRGLLNRAVEQMSYRIAPGNPASGHLPNPHPTSPNPRHPRTEILFYIGNRK